jgi:hypothetical protein
MNETNFYRYQVRDLRGEAETRKFENRKQAEWWFSHLFEVRPNSRCIIEEINEVKETE